MDIHGSETFQRAMTVDGGEYDFGPKYKRSSPLQDLNVDRKSQDLITWVRRGETFTGWFTFNSKREEGVIDVCKNYGPLTKIITLEKVENESRGECKLPVNEEFYPVLYKLYKEKRNWGQDFKFRGLATFQPYLMEWTETVLVEYGDILRQANIYGGVAISSYSYERCKDVWRAFCELWSPLTNTLHHGVGEMSVSLYDLKVIGGLPILGIHYEEFLPSNQELMIESKYPSTISELLRIHATLCDHLGDSKVTWTQWIHFFYREKVKYAGYGENPKSSYKKGEEFRQTMQQLPLKISQKGALAAYLALWLSRFVFPYGNTVVRPETFHMASLMAEGNIVSLAPSVLGYIYQGLGEVANYPKDPGAANPNFPIHYVLGWLGEHFPTLYRWRPHDEFPSEYPLLIRYAGVRGEEIDIYAARIVFRNDQYVSFRPTSFDEDNGVDYLDTEDLLDKHFEFLVFIRSTLLPVRVGTNLCVQPYYPNRFGRQFGFDQGIPTNKLRFNFAQRFQRIELVAKAQALVLKRGTSTLFHIPRGSQSGTCTYWYCGWWVRNTTPYLGISVQKVHLTLTKRNYAQEEPVFVIKNIRAPTSNIRGVISLTDVEGAVPAIGIGHGGTPCFINKTKIRPRRELSPSDKNYKRVRYDRSSGSDDTDTTDAGLSFTDLPIDGSPDIGSSALGSATIVADELVDYEGPDDHITTEFSDGFILNEPIIDASSEALLQNPEIPFSLDNLSLPMANKLDQLARDFAIGIVRESVNQLSSKSSPQTLLACRSSMTQSLEMIKRVITEVDSGRDVVEWYDNVVSQIFNLSEMIVSDENELSQGGGFDVALLNDLVAQHAKCLKVKQQLDIELVNSSKRSEELKVREAQILEEESRLLAMKSDLEIDKMGVEAKMKELESSLETQDKLEQELQRSMVKAGKEKLQEFENRKKEFQNLICALNLFCNQS